MLPVSNLLSNYPLQISSYLRAFRSQVNARQPTHCWAQSYRLRCLVPEPNTDLVDNICTVLTVATDSGIHHLPSEPSLFLILWYNPWFWRKKKKSDCDKTKKKWDHGSTVPEHPCSATCIINFFSFSCLGKPNPVLCTLLPPGMTTETTFLCCGEVLWKSSIKATESRYSG